MLFRTNRFNSHKPWQNTINITGGTIHEGNAGNKHSLQKATLEIKFSKVTISHQNFSHKANPSPQEGGKGEQDFKAISFS